jgi:glucuronate isomerase
MKSFMDKDFLLSNEVAVQLYHQYAAQMPIIDYHCHLSPKDIAENRQFSNLSEVWLHGDHYKWRAMRTNGVDESYCTGNRSDWEKFEKWAETVPYTLRNPLFHWTHLELQRYFDVTELLSEKNAKEIYEHCNALLNTPAFSTINLLRKMNVKLVCTTDDPLDDLAYHRRLRDTHQDIKMLPAFRPDKAMEVTHTGNFLAYIKQLEIVSGLTVKDFSTYLSALKSRHDYFAAMGCCVSDHGLEEIYAEDYTQLDVESIFKKLLHGETLSVHEVRQFKSAMLIYFAQWDHEKGWVQQFHLGALRNNNARKMKELGPDTGWDSIGNFNHGKPLSSFLNKLDADDKLTKTILYNLNPSDNELMATMIGNFNDGSIPGKLQFGASWWFLDQKDGIIRQLDALSYMGLLSRFIGMLTDSRSFLSFPRHEYFRRILCDLLGREAVAGELPADLNLLGKMVSDICYENNRNYFNWPV